MRIRQGHLTVRVLVIAMVPAGLAPAQKIYWSAGGSARIQRFDLRDPNIWNAEDLVFTDHIRPGAMALDLGSGKIYFVSSGRGVVRANIDGTNVESVTSAENGSLGPLAIDASAGKIYWARDGDSRRIQRANPDGSEYEVILEGVYAAGIAIDSLGQKIYWTGAGIHRANLDGSNRENVVTDLGGPVGLAVDSVAGKIYWTDAKRFSERVLRANLDGSDIEELTLLDPASKPREIALDLPGGKMYWREKTSNRIMRANLDGSNVEVWLLVTISGLNHWGFAVDVQARKLYWGEDYRVKRANLDGSSPEDVIVTMETTPQSIDLDTEHGKLYWADRTYKAIRRSNLNGSDIEVVLSVESWPMGIALDVANDKMYWSENFPHGIGSGIRRANLDGSNVEQLVPSVGAVGEIMLDLPNGKMYWRAGWTIRRANMDASNDERVVNFAGEPGGFSLDRVEGKIYWCASFWDLTAFFQAIRRADLDGSNIEDVTLSYHCAALVIDASARKAYLDGSIVSRFNLDFSGRELVVRASGPVWGMALDMRMPSDCDKNSLVDLPDHKSFVQCMTGPGGEFAPGCSCVDDTGDRAVDLADFAALQVAFTGPGP
ncbi:MAG: hypothetical protein QGM45_11875 [Anaerolineales bacterium]|nr:hypothetical protein [Anaerolineales bacterium]